jgi:flagellar biosynthesis GTPase FlhF
MNDEQLVIQIGDAVAAYHKAEDKHSATGDTLDAKAKALGELLLIAHEQHTGVQKFEAFLARLPKAQRISRSWAFKLMRRVQSPVEAKKQKAANARDNRLSRERRKTENAAKSDARARADEAKAQAAKARASQARAEAAKARAEARAKRDHFRSKIHETVFGGRGRKVEMDAKTRETLVKALGMLGSEHDGEVLAAARMVEKVRRKLGVTWDQIIVDAAEPMREAA